MNDSHLELFLGEESCMYKNQIDNYVLKDDSGFDVYYPETFTIQPGETKLISLKIKARVVKGADYEYLPYWLVPRSSIFKTHLRMANSVGIIDSGYRGFLGTPLDNIGNDPVTIEAGTRLFQICSNNLMPFKSVKQVESLDSTERGVGGFGSTGMN